jgi:hypothetical protein
MLFVQEFKKKKAKNMDLRSMLCNLNSDKFSKVEKNLLEETKILFMKYKRLKQIIIRKLSIYNNNYTN